MHWLKALLGFRDDRPQASAEAFQRREAELRERHERLERLAVEADVLMRTDQPEGHSWDAR